MKLKLTPLLAVLALFLVSCWPSDTLQPEAAWDPSPDVQIFMASDPGHFPALRTPDTGHGFENFIPDAQVWGDGRIVWVDYTDGRRRLLEGYLSHQQMVDLSKKFIGAGFFGWDKVYGSTTTAVDGKPPALLQAELENAKNRVSVGEGQPPAGFENLFQSLSNGAGANGSEYTPVKAFLCAYLDPAEPPKGASWPEWPAQRADFELADSGCWYIERETLDFVWHTINDNLAWPVVSSGGKLYSLILLVPGLSPTEPPPLQTPPVTQAPATRQVNPHVEISVSKEVVKAGDTFTITANAVDIGLPYYYLMVKDSGQETAQQLVGIKNGAADMQPSASQILAYVSFRQSNGQIEIVLKAVKVGVVELYINVTGEVHYPAPEGQPGPGPATWSGGASDVITISVTK